MDVVHVTSLFTRYSLCVRVLLLLWDRKQSEFLLLFEKSCKANTVDFSCWAKELSLGYVPMLFAHTGSPAKR